MVCDPHYRDNSKLYNIHNDYGHLTEDCRQLMWEVDKKLKQ